MHPPAFWLSSKSSIFARLLQPLGGVYGAVTAARMGRPGYVSSLPVICIGNFTVGGSGKTPTAIAIAELLFQLGEQPILLTRGYGGRLAGPVRVDPYVHHASQTGDEPLLLARTAPVIVSRDRAAGARLAQDTEASVIVMDDGFQNPTLAKNGSLIVIDGETGLGNRLCLPAGPLRAPMTRQWRAADAIVLVGGGERGQSLAGEAERYRKPVFRAKLTANAASAETLRGRRVLAFAGIGRPQKFFDTLEACGAILAAQRSFPDHHPFTERDITALAAWADGQGLGLVTTEKDLIRLGASDAFDRIADRISAVPVKLTFENEIDVKRALKRILASRRN